MIKIENSTFGYNRNGLLFNDRNMHLYQGRRYGIFGMNGLGKTTSLFGCAYNNKSIFGMNGKGKTKPKREEIISHKSVLMAFC